MSLIFIINFFILIFIIFSLYSIKSESEIKTLPGKRLKTQEEIENFIDTGGGDGIIKAMYEENKHFFAKGLYVHSKADAAAMNVW